MMQSTMRYMSMLLCFSCGLFPGQAQEKTLSLKLNTDAQTIAFDPKSCEIGARGEVHTGCIGAAVLILARQDGYCIFDYLTDGCGGVLAQY